LFDIKIGGLEAHIKQVVDESVDAAFAHRRKGLRGALRTLAGSIGDATAALESVGIDPLARGESLSVEQFARLAEAIRW